MSFNEILKASGFQNIDGIISAAEKVGIPLYIAVTMIEKESGGRNVYGHDVGGIFSVPGQNIEVTEVNYKEFRRRLAAGEKSNGVGPTQITWPGFFPDADKKGLQLWKPYDNILYGFTLLNSYLKGKEDDETIKNAGTRYNGKESYGVDFLTKAKKWKQKLAQTEESKMTYIQATKYGSGGNSPIKWIVMHTTESPTDRAVAVARYFQSGVVASAHYVVGTDDTVQCVREGDRAWHCGYNTGSLGIEQCGYSNKTNWTSGEGKTVVAKSAALVKSLCQKYGIPMKRLTNAELKAGQKGIVGHDQMSQVFHASDHMDPGSTYPWATFISLVNGGAPVDPPKPPPSTPGTFTVRVTADVLNIRKGPGTNYGTNGAIKDKGTYTITDTSGDWGKLKSGAGWIHLGYTTRVGVPAPKPPTPSTFKVQVTASGLNYRSGPGTNYKVNSTITDKGIYTIVETSGQWGKLKSGAGWIHLGYTKRV